MDKYDQEKPRTDLVPASLIIETAKVLGFGARKYSAHQWREGCDWSRMYGAALRHILAWNDGEDLDPESGLSHLAHASCCIAFLIEYEQKQLGRDDRPKIPISNLTFDGNLGQI